LLKFSFACSFDEVRSSYLLLRLSSSQICFAAVAAQSDLAILFSDCLHLRCCYLLVSVNFCCLGLMQTALIFCFLYSTCIGCFHVSLSCVTILNHLDYVSGRHVMPTGRHSANLVKFTPCTCTSYSQGFCKWNILRKYIQEIILYLHIVFCVKYLARVIGWTNNSHI